MSTIKVDTLQTAAGVEVYAAKAWINFNGTGTVAIRDSGNVSSVTDFGTGAYAVNFTNAMTDQDFAYSHSYSNETNVYHTVGFWATYLSTLIRVGHYNVTNSANTADKAIVTIAVYK